MSHATQGYICDDCRRPAHAPKHACSLKALFAWICWKVLNSKQRKVRQSRPMDPRSNAKATKACAQYYAAACNFIDDWVTSKPGSEVHENPIHRNSVRPAANLSIPQIRRRDTFFCHATQGAGLGCSLSVSKRFGHTPHMRHTGIEIKAQDQVENIRVPGVRIIAVLCLERMRERGHITVVPAD
jgi:hypothetical protein